MTRRAPLFVAIAAILLTVAYWYLLYQPRRAEQARYVEQTARLEAERGELQAQIAVLREVEQNEEDYRSQFVRLREYIPDDPGQPETLAALQQAADSSGVEITQMTFSDPELVEDAPETNQEKTALARIPTQMTVTGGYFQVVDLLRRIEVDLSRAIKVSSVTMAEEEENSFPDLSVTWTGHIFAVLPLLETAGGDVEIIDSGGAPADSPSETATAAATEAATEGAGPGTAEPDTTIDGETP